MELPPALAPWGVHLEMFPPVLALSLGPLLQRLASALGPLRGRQQDGDGEMDGFDGLTRRGSYERLLVSEWLLAEEAPEEFLRRAAAGEHTFLRLYRPEPAGSRRSVALFDSGPAQLGSPRIAQLAALIVLARRAEAAGARFEWGTLQRPDLPLETAVTPESVLHLLRSRTMEEAGEAQIEAWHERLKGWPDLDDAWIVGPPRLGAAPALRAASFLEIRDELEPGARRVAVAVHRGGAVGDRIFLELPENAACARLLRDPFGIEVAAPNRLPGMEWPASNLVFSRKGQHVLARARGGGVVALPVPNSPRAGRKLPTLHFAKVDSGEILAVSAEKLRISVGIRRLAGLEVGTSTPTQPDAPGGVYWFGSGHEPFRTGPSTPLRAIFRLQQAAFTLDARGSLFQLVEAQLRRLDLVQRRVLACIVRENGLVVVVSDLDRRLSFAAIESTGFVRILEVFKGFDATEAFFGYGARHQRPHYGLAAVQRSDRDWVLFHKADSTQSGTTQLRLFSGTRAVGVARSVQHGDAGMLLLEEDGRTLSLVGRNWHQKLLTATAEIRHVTVSHAAPSLAYWTAGEVVIASTENGNVLARWVLEEG
jgi:hypothetical protein